MVSNPGCCLRLMFLLCLRQTVQGAFLVLLVCWIVNLLCRANNCVLTRPLSVCRLLFPLFFLQVPMVCLSRTPPCV